MCLNTPNKDDVGSRTELELTRAFDAQMSIMDVLGYGACNAWHHNDDTVEGRSQCYGRNDSGSNARPGCLLVARSSLIRRQNCQVVECPRVWAGYRGWQPELCKISFGKVSSLRYIGDNARSPK